MMTAMPQPTIARNVVYRSRTGDYSIPAIISATTESINQAGVEAGRIPALSSPDHVHLVCFTPGDPAVFADGRAISSETPRHTVQRINLDRPLGDRAALPTDDGPSIIKVATPFGGTYAEWDIPYWEAPFGTWALADQPAGTWTWPA